MAGEKPLYKDCGKPCTYFRFCLQRARMHTFLAGLTMVVGPKYVSLQKK
jgi:hypothetical protein